MKGTTDGFVMVKITKPVIHPPYNLGYTVGEEAIVSHEVAKLLIQDERATLIVAKEGDAARSSEKAISKQAQTAEKR